MVFRAHVHLWAAEAHLRAGLLDAAFGNAGRALEIARNNSERGHEGWALRLLADAISQREHPDANKAQAYFREALLLADELGMHPLQAHCHFGLGKLCQRTTNRQQAREHLTTAHAMYREMNMPYWQEQAEAELRG
jgi:tetratricopeptide (TPR) repeat protein